MNIPISACIRLLKKKHPSWFADNWGKAWKQTKQNLNYSCSYCNHHCLFLVTPIFLPICMLIQLHLTATCGGPSWTSSSRCILVPRFVLFILGCMWRQIGCGACWGQCCDFGLGTGFNYHGELVLLMVMDVTCLVPWVLFYALVYLVHSRFLEPVGAQSSDCCVILYKIDQEFWLLGFFSV